MRTSQQIRAAIHAMCESATYDKVALGKLLDELGRAIMGEYYAS